MRKYLIAAVAALAVVAFSAVAYAQGGGATLDTKVTPTKAGTKQKPKNSTFTLDVVNDDTTRTMSELDVFLPKNVKLNLKGMPTCARDDIFNLDCKSSTVLGKGEAKAKVGVNGPPANIRDLTFKVTAYKTKSETGKDMLGFFIDDGASLKFLTETTLKKASGKYGQVLNIEVPELAQRVGTAPNFTYNGLVSLHTTLNKKAGNNKYLISSVGCANKKHPYRTVLTFIDNTISPAGTAEDTDNATCKK